MGLMNAPDIYFAGSDVIDALYINKLCYCDEILVGKCYSARAMINKLLVIVDS
jgi:hypothetical protein